jgi:hypothetical protein
MFTHPKYKHISYTILAVGQDSYGQFVEYRTNTSNFIRKSNLCDLEKWFLNEVDKFMLN